MEAFRLSISHLEKSKQKNLKKKIEFLFDNEVQCHSINEETCAIAMELFSRFQDHIKPKDNIKNIINDLLILATAIERKMSILTVDKVLGKFAAKEHSGRIINESESLMVDFSAEPDGNTKRNCESKGYINRGWSYSLLKGNL